MCNHMVRESNSQNWKYMVDLPLRFCKDLPHSYRRTKPARGWTGWTSKWNCLSRTSGRRNKLRLAIMWRINYKQSFKRGARIWERLTVLHHKFLMVPSSVSVSTRLEKEKKKTNHNIVRFWNVQFKILAHVWLTMKARVQAPHNSGISSDALKLS